METQPKYLFKVKEFYWDNHRMPSYAEMAEVLGFRSRNAAVELANKWLEQGIIRKDSAGKLSPGRLFMPLHLLGTIQAGVPTAAEQQDLDTISLDEWLIRDREASFMLKVTGDSMVDAGIQEGDMVILERGKQPKNGDIVVAEVDKDWTLKYFQKKGAAVTLMPANKKYKPIIPREELKVAGVVTAVVRKY